MSSTTSIFDKVSNLLTSDIMFLLSLFVVLFVLVMYLGKSRFVSAILAFYPATLIYLAFPFTSTLLVLSGDMAVFLNKLAIFLLFFIPVYFIINKFVSHYGQYGAMDGILRTGGLVISLMILFVLFSYTILNLDTIHNFGSQIDTIFGGEAKLFWWRLVPLALLAFL